MKEAELTEGLLKNIESRKALIRQNLLEWEGHHFRDFPWRKNRTPYSVLVAEVLLKRTTATAANRVYAEFMARFPNLETLRTADSTKLEGILRKIGYHKRRTNILVEMSSFILKRYGGKIPKSKEELLNIPHVGYYTANAVLTFGYGIPTAIVDSNVARIIGRLFLNNLSKRPSTQMFQRIADSLSSKENNDCYNYALLDIGALVCRYSIPKCEVCPLKSVCDYSSSVRALARVGGT